MSQIPALVVAPCVEPRLRKQLLVKPLPARTLEEGLFWDAKGRAGDGAPKSGVLVVRVEGFLGVDVSEVR